MKGSPLQLLRYWTPEISCFAISNHDPGEPFQNNEDLFKVDATVSPQEKAEDFPGTMWLIDLRISQKAPDDKNLPYRFDVQLVGFFGCSGNISTDLDEPTFVEIQGCSILYGAAREVIRSLTAHGPWGEFMIPTVSFNDKPPSKKPAVARSTAKRTG